METPVVIVNYGMGNIGSVVNAFDDLGISTLVSSDPKALEKAKVIILPGVGAFSAAMENLRALGLEEELHRQVVGKKKPFLGICLGMQLIAEDSMEQGHSKGLGWIAGHVKKIEPVESLPVPHVGWNEVETRSDDNVGFEKVPNGSHFYFDHSFHLDCPAEFVAATCSYGGSLVAAVRKENIFAVQFHPEKSQRNGLRLLRNFINFAKGG